jgi:hypothetical protein
MSENNWKRARKPGFTGELTKDQLLRLSAVIGIYKRRATGRCRHRRRAAASPLYPDLSRRGAWRRMRKTELSVRGLVRLLPATYHKPPALSGLVDSDAELVILAEIEGLTSAPVSIPATGLTQT